MVKKYTKKRDARAKLSFCHNKPIVFLPFSLQSPSPSPSSLLKLPIVVLKRFFYHSNVTSYFSPLYKYRALEFYKLKSNVIPSEAGNRGYYMATRRYEISLRVLKNISRVSAANE